MTDEIVKRIIDLESSVDVIQKDIHWISKEIENLKTTVDSVFTLFKENPESSLMKARKTAEGIAKKLYDHFNCQAKNNGKPSSKIMLDELINVIRKEAIPKLVISGLVNIQNLGNFAAHDQGAENETISMASALPAMTSLGYVASWYLQTICGEDSQTSDLRILANLSNSLSSENEPSKSLNTPLIVNKDQDNKDRLNAPQIATKSAGSFSEPKAYGENEGVFPPIQPAHNIRTKIQNAMFRRYKPGEMLSSSTIIDNVLEDYPNTNRTSVIPTDYFSNHCNKDPNSGIYHIFEKVGRQCKLLPKIDLTYPRPRPD